MAEDISDLSSPIAQIQVQFRLQGLNWDSPRVQAWMQRIGVTDYRQLPDRALLSLSRHLNKSLPTAQTEKHCGLIADTYPASYEIQDQSPHVRIELNLYGIPPDRLQQWIEDSFNALDDWLKTEPIGSIDDEQEPQTTEPETGETIA